LNHITHFTADWFTQYAEQWLERLGYLRNQETHALEIGSYEGRSACWMLDNILTHVQSDIVCVDTWDGKDKTLGEETIRAKQRFQKNMKFYRSKVDVVELDSLRALTGFILDKESFDLIFIDGDHEGYSALTDLILSWHLLKSGGWLVFDDYLWEHVALRTNPKDAWDAFVSVSPLGMTWELVGRQVFARKQ
jgi:predicted O-methyltransferase YrrM